MNNAAASARTQTQPYRFTATAVLGVESYQSTPVVPEWANVRRVTALARVLLTKVPDRDPAGWEPWLGNVTERWPVSLAPDSYTIRKLPKGRSYEVGRTFALQVFAEHREEARTIATECFEAGTEAGFFTSYTIGTDKPIDRYDRGDKYKSRSSGAEEEVDMS